MNYKYWSLLHSPAFGGPPELSWLAAARQRRMDAANGAPFDNYLLPRIDIITAELKLAEENGLVLDGYRFESLDGFYEFLKPVNVTMEAARWINLRATK